MSGCFVVFVIFSLVVFTENVVVCTRVKLELIFLLTVVLSNKETEVASKSSMAVVEFVLFRAVVVLGGSSKSNESFSARGTIVDSAIAVVVKVVESCSSVVVGGDGWVTVVGVVVDLVVVVGCVVVGTVVVVVGTVVVVVGTVVVVDNVVVGCVVVVQILCS